MTDSNRFQLLLDWLDQNAIGYEQAINRLRRYFEVRGVWTADGDDLASEVLWRTAFKVEEGSLVGSGWGALLGIAKNVFLEWKKRRERAGFETIPELVDPTPPPDAFLSSKQSMWAVEECLRSALNPDGRQLLLRYRFESESGRRAIAEERGITLNAIRVRIHTTEGRLATCVQCLDRLPLKERALLLRRGSARSDGADENFVAEVRAVREKLWRCSRRVSTYSLVIEPTESETSYVFPEITKKLKLLFAIPLNKAFVTYRLVVASRSDIRIDRSGLKAEPAGLSMGVPLQLSAEQAQGRSFQAGVSGEGRSSGEPETELATYRFELSTQKSKNFPNI